ncbi:hypothetical protein [Streptacidiphilus fuscans]|uniref:Uncharacterized protein n=1 Tax=Streptacidiphilus fuscans TaxID=2789292 RepID=A0A931B6F3_9ACTN|nr:hypothetical protein [Streptacidiphilus fuscans]MBF9067770.1 hypothetical protein [Streptacidiphilus fuscans]
MLDPTPLVAAAERLADRFRSLPQSRLSRCAPAGLALARGMASAAGAPREVPDVGAFVVGDQIAATAHDLAHALAAGEVRDAERVLAETLASIAEVSEL